MIFIHGSLAVGGIETFYVRMVETFAKSGSKAKILLLNHKIKTNPGLLQEAEKYADVRFLTDYTSLPSFICKYLPAPLLLLLPIRKELKTLFMGESLVHVSAGMPAFMYLRLAKRLGLDIPLTIGVYHSREFTGGRPDELPFYERMNRKLFFDVIDSRNIIFFYEKIIDIHESYCGRSLKNVNVFPIGVVRASTEAMPVVRSPSDTLLLGSVGRFAHFKSYNLWMLDVVADLLKRNLRVRYDIYGYGPLKELMLSKIVELNIQDSVKINDLLDYAQFNQTVREFDIFVGSGTAVIEAANLGVPTLIGIEYIKEPITYDYFAYLQGYSYNEDNLFKKSLMIEQILRYLNMNKDERIQLSQAHIAKAREFSMEACLENFRQIKALRFDRATIDQYGRLWFRLRYAASFASFLVRCWVHGKSLAQVIYDRT